MVPRNNRLKSSGPECQRWRCSVAVFASPLCAPVGRFIGFTGCPTYDADWSKFMQPFETRLLRVFDKLSRRNLCFSRSYRGP